MRIEYPITKDPLAKLFKARQRKVLHSDDEPDSYRQYVNLRSISYELGFNTITKNITTTSIGSIAISGQVTSSNFTIDQCINMLISI